VQGNLTTRESFGFLGTTKWHFDLKVKGFNHRLLIREIEVVTAMPEVEGRGYPTGGVRDE